MEICHRPIGQENFYGWEQHVGMGFGKAIATYPSRCATVEGSHHSRAALIIDTA